MIELEAVILQGWETLYLIMNDSLQGQYMQVHERAGEESSTWLLLCTVVQVYQRWQASVLNNNMNYVLNMN